MTPAMKAFCKQGRSITYRKPFCTSMQARPCRAPRDAHAYPGSVLLAQQWTPPHAGCGCLAPPSPQHPTTLPHRPQVPHSEALGGGRAVCPQEVEGMLGSSASLAPTQPSPT